MRGWEVCDSLHMCVILCMRGWECVCISVCVWMYVCENSSVHMWACACECARKGDHSDWQTGRRSSLLSCIVQIFQLLLYLRQFFFNQTLPWNIGIIFVRGHHEFGAGKNLSVLLTSFTNLAGSECPRKARNWPHVEKKINKGPIWQRYVDKNTVTSETGERGRYSGKHTCVL